MAHSDPDYTEYQQYVQYLKETGQDKPPAPKPPQINPFSTAANIEEKSAFRKAADMATAAVGGLASTVGTPQYPGMQKAMSEHPDATSVGHGAATLVEGYAAPKAALMAGGAGLGALLRGANSAYKGVKGLASGGVSGMLEKAANAVSPAAESTAEIAPSMADKYSAFSSSKPISGIEAFLRSKLGK